MTQIGKYGKGDYPLIRRSS